MYAEGAEIAKDAEKRGGRDGKYPPSTVFGEGGLGSAETVCVNRASPKTPP